MTPFEKQLRERLAVPNYALARSSTVKSQHDYVDGVERENKRTQPIVEVLIRIAIELNESTEAGYDYALDALDALKRLLKESAGRAE